MAALDPAVAAVRHAVQRCVSTEVLVACSGGPDSMALAAAAMWIGPRAGHRVGLVTVDHQLQPGSADQAQRVAVWARSMGFNPVVVSTVDVAGRPGGPEAAARDARYEALIEAAVANRYRTVLLGHTRDDQAETVLLGLVRGAGPRAISGMPTKRLRSGVAFVRPLLDVSRAETRAAALAQGVPIWDDPHNGDPSYRRTQARELLSSLEARLGPAVVPNLARTAKLIAADTALLDQMAADALEKAATPEGLRVGDLVGLGEAIRTRMLHTWALSLGVPGSALGHAHVTALDMLATDGRGHGEVWLPGGVAVARRQRYLVRLDRSDSADR